MEIIISTTMCLLFFTAFAILTGYYSHRYMNTTRSKGLRTKIIPMLLLGVLFAVYYAYIIVLNTSRGTAINEYDYTNNLIFLRTLRMFNEIVFKCLWSVAIYYIISEYFKFNYTIIGHKEDVRSLLIIYTGIKMMLYFFMIFFIYSSYTIFTLLYEFYSIVENAFFIFLIIELGIEIVNTHMTSDQIESNSTLNLFIKQRVFYALECGISGFILDTLYRIVYIIHDLSEKSAGDTNIHYIFVIKIASIVLIMIATLESIMVTSEKNDFEKMFKESIRENQHFIFDPHGKTFFNQVKEISNRELSEEESATYNNNVYVQTEVVELIEMGYRNYKKMI